MTIEQGDLRASSPFLAYRSGVAILWCAFWGMIAFVASASAVIGEVFVQLQMTDLPWASQVSLFIGGFFRSAVGTVLAIVAFVSGLGLLFRGVLDRRSAAILVALATALFVLLGVAFLGRFRPLTQIQQCLSK